MKPMVPTFDEACELALCLCNDLTMNAMQRSAAANIVNFLERSAGPALKAESEHVAITINANVAAFEKATEEKFKPALRSAIAEVVDEFLNDVVTASMSITEGGAK